MATENGAWTVPPQQAVWVPAGVRHAVEAAGRLSMRFLYLHPGSVKRLARECCVLGITPLVRELIARLTRLPQAEMSTPRGRRLVGVLLDELHTLEPEPLHLPLPADERLKRVTAALLAFSL